ncbi:mechanosensitive ion channel family protein [Candidatus Woesearchaeota archaeon]|nr:mechanosensitive ion channel family protein [Candidatus Woesearchaeota archaeon]
MGSLGRIILIVIILAATVVVARITKRLLHRYFHKAKKAKLVRVDETTYAFLKHFITGVIYVVGIGVALYTIPGFRTLSVSLFAGAGILAVIIGFASQAAFSNIVSGVFISIFKPFRVGDRIKLQSGLYGVVEDITLRHTVIKTFENIRHVMPNSKISEETIENMDLGDPEIHKFIEYGISYDSDIDKAARVIREELTKHPDFLDKRTAEQKRKKEPAVTVRVVAWGDFSIQLRAAVWTKDNAAAYRLRTDTLKSIKERFDEEGIEIPFPYRTVVMKKDRKKSSRRKRI